MSVEKTVISDLLVLGNAVPDIISDNRITVCTAGISKTHGLIRIYPVPVVSHMRRWNIVKVPLERNPKDNRPESWKIQGSKGEWDRIAGKIELKGQVKDKDEKFAILDNLHAEFGVECVKDLNDKKASLGMVNPQSMSCAFEKRDDHDKEMQTSLDGTEPFLTIKNYPLKPVMTYRCPKCRTKNPHRQQVMEWGVFEWMRKNPHQPEKVFENLHIGEVGYDTGLLVGNMALHRNSFLVISIFRLKLPS
ncbi:MAG: hypothetical protein JRN43_01820 [Nitrososphaerota archaeon]|nr:hypothetical protein [Nitrososphaerota archaeon]MDG7019032.1 hypothetical protein [Nitrososphaerota archaeon]